MLTPALTGPQESPMTDDTRAVLLALAEHEEAMSALYSAYAGEYPEVADLWKALARDEHGHGALLRSLADDAGDMTAFVRNRGYDLAEVEADTARLRDLARIVPVAGFPLQEAFHTALQLEASLIESQIFVVHEGDPPRVTAVVGTLRDQTEKHHTRLREQSMALGG
jgi:hypothetical protein